MRWSRGAANPVHVGKTLTWDTRADAPGTTSPAFFLDRHRVVVVSLNHRTVSEKPS